jgi:precorrin-6A/cobalt-precorrin-6A reductase
MEEHRIDALVTKNSGGDATAAKLVAARQLGLPVVVVSRPASPVGPLARSVDEALSWVDAALAAGGRGAAGRQVGETGAG